MKPNSYRSATPPAPMKRHRLSLLAGFSLLSGLLCADEQIRPASNPAVSQPPAAARPNPAIAGDVQRSVMRVTNPKGVYPFEDYTCGSFIQRVTKESDTAVTIRTEAPKQLPMPAQPYPITQIPDKAAPYVKPTPRIQSDDPAIAGAARDILKAVNPTTQADVVMAVCTWTRKHMKWALPDEVPDAFTCLKRKRGNCIGFSHLAAALLRNLGVPVRTMRVFVVTGSGRLTRHTLIEVYYPDQDLWVACDPQLGGSVFPNMIYLFTDPDWSVEGQRKTRPFSVDPKTRVVLQSR